MPRTETKHIGLFGGSFDPIHFGHLKPIVEVASEMALTKVIYLPCYQQPLKQQAHSAAADREAMCRLAINSMNSPIKLELDRYEIDQGGKSFTIDTIEYFQNREPKANWYFFVGLDSLLSLNRWHRWQAIIKKVTLVVMMRPGSTLDLCKLEPEIVSAIGHQIILVENDPVNISSTELRQLIKQKQFNELSKFMPPPVIEYLRVHRLYID